MRIEDKSNNLSTKVLYYNVEENVFFVGNVDHQLMSWICWGPWNRYEHHMEIAIREIYDMYVSNSIKHKASKSYSHYCSEVANNILSAYSEHMI